MNDFTQITLARDPLRQRLKGTTSVQHGSRDFDVPYLSHIEGRLWMGGTAQGLDLPGPIEHLVTLYPWESYRLSEAVLTRLEVTAYDAEVELLQDQLESLSDWVLHCLDRGPTAVTCLAGLNRSGLVTALVLIKQGRTPEQAIALLRARRSPAVLCNRSFENWLLRYQNRAAAQ